MSPGSARALLRRTRDRCRRAPSLVDALRRGDSSHAHAWELDKACAELPDDGAADVAQACGRVLVHGTKQEAAKRLARTVTDWHLAHPGASQDDEPDTPPDPVKGPRGTRSVEAGPSHLPGMSWLIALLPTEDTAALMARLEEGAKLAKAAGDPRTREQIMADLLADFGWHGLPHDDLLDLLHHYDTETAAEAAAPAGDAVAAAAAEGPVIDPYAGFWGLADTVPTSTQAGDPDAVDGTADAAGPAGDPPRAGAAPSTGPPPPRSPWDPETGLTARQLALLTALTGQVRAQVHATVSLETLLGLREHTAQIATAGPGHRGTDLGPVPPDLARALAARPDSLWDRYVHDENGVLQGVSASYVVPETLRRTVLAEYVTCTFYGCPKPAAECDTDHVTDWAKGGKTEHANLGPADRTHHNLKTHGSWELARDNAGLMTWTSPYGQTVTTDPADYRPRQHRYLWT